MIEASNSPPRVETLKAKHFRLLNPNIPLPRLQAVLFRSWLGQLENHLQGIITTKNPICFVSLEGDQLTSLVVLVPYNSRGSCWYLDIPVLLEPSKAHSQAEYHQNIVQRSIDLGNIHTKSWLLRCQANDNKKICIARELGFQPLKYFQSWRPPRDQDDIRKMVARNKWPEGISWEKVSKKTAPLLLQLEKAGASGHQRQIIDRQWQDLLSQNKVGTGILLAKRGTSESALLGLVGHPESGLEATTLELLRESAWDNRIEECLPIILYELINSSEEIKIQTARDDEKLNQLLLDHGWGKSHEEILLGKTLLRRQSSKRLAQGAKPLEAMLGRLNPQTPPLPTPLVGRN